MKSPENGSVTRTDGDEKYDLNSIICTPKRDFLIRNNGDQVKIDSLKGKVVGLYFSGSWCGPCKQFTPKLAEVYYELKQLGKFEIVFVSHDKGNESFDYYFSNMPWLAIPFSDSKTRKQLNEMFYVRGIPRLVLLDDNGKVLSNEGVKIIQEYEAEGYPFVPEHIAKLKELEEEAKKNQSLDSVLVSPSRDYVIAANGKQVPVAELEGKTVCLYFALLTHNGCRAFNPKLVEVYNSLKEEGDNFEIVMVPLGDDKASFEKEFEQMPWLSLPLKDKFCDKLAHYFELSNLPTVVAIGPDGRTLHPNVVEAIEERGNKAYPFTPEKFSELDEIMKARQEAQTLESILVSEDCDFVIGKDGATIPILNLVGKNVLLYFSAHWCSPCRAFMPKLIQAYQDINAKDNSLEVIFISSDRDQASFDEFFSKMPWLAIPFGDKRKQSLSQLFKVRGIPKVVAIGPTGKTVSLKARELITSHGAEAYPFTAERLKDIEAENERLAEGWPKKVKDEIHKHELHLVKRLSYICNGCDEEGQVWSYYCDKCDFDLHPKCCLDDGDKGMKGGDEEISSGVICDGDKCYRK